MAKAGRKRKPSAPRTKSGQISRAVAAAKAKVGLGTRAAGTPGGLGGLIFQTIVAIYGGFFGAGMGILTLAALAIQGVDDMQELNGLKNLTSAVNYTVATATFSSEHPANDAAAKSAAASFIHPFIVIPFTGPARNYLSSFFTKSRM